MGGSENSDCHWGVGGAVRGGVEDLGAGAVNVTLICATVNTMLIYGWLDVGLTGNKIPDLGSVGASQATAFT